MRAEDILALGRRSLLPLAALTQFENPAETLPRVIIAICAEPDAQKQANLLSQLTALLKDEELIAMTDQVLSDLDLEELKEYPVLWRSDQRWVHRTKAEAESDLTRKHILEALVTRFNPPAADYRPVEKVIAAIDDPERLTALFRRALRVDDFATFAAELANAE